RSTPEISAPTAAVRNFTLMAIFASSGAVQSVRDRGSPRGLARVDATIPASARNATPGLGAHWECAQAGRTQWLGKVGKLAQQLARIARVDDLLDPERLRGPERRAQSIEAGLDLGELGAGIGCGLELGAIGRFDPALERQGSPPGRQPGVAHGKPAGGDMRRPC